MSGRSRFTDADILKMRDLRWKDRHTVEEIAGIMDCCPGTVWRWTSTECMPERTITRRQRIAAMLKNGLDAIDIANRMHWKLDTVRVVVSQLKSAAAKSRLAVSSREVQPTLPAAPAPTGAAGFSGWAIVNGKLVFRGAATLTGAGMRP